jgi:hypothetical protein
MAAGVSTLYSDSRDRKVCVVLETCLHARGSLMAGLWGRKSRAKSLKRGTWGSTPKGRSKNLTKRLWGSSKRSKRGRGLW